MHFYDYNRVLSYGCPVNVLIGERGVGKSYGAKQYVINQYKKKKSSFLYLRRYDNELKTALEKDNSGKDFFTDIRNAFPDITLETKNRKFYFNNEIFGYAKRMTASQDIKSGTYENIKTIIIDEYPIEKNKRYYLPNERYDFDEYLWLNY